MNKKLFELESRLAPSPRTPVLFVGHGNPMNAILDNPITQSWASIGKNLPSAQAIVVISAHWLTRGTRITDAPKQPLVYDMYGFPDELYAVKYPAPGNPEFAEILRRQFLSYEAQLDSSWGLDHGTWSVLKHLAPHADTPVLQISIDVGQSLQDLTKMFALLKPLREKGVIFIGSGNIVHNLRALNFSDERIFEWAAEFDGLTSELITKKDIVALTQPYRISSAAKMAVPTDDHYRPMLAALSLAYEDESIEFFNNTIEMGSISMRSFQVS